MAEDRQQALSRGVLEAQIFLAVQHQTEPGTEESKWASNSFDSRPLADMIDLKVRHERALALLDAADKIQALHPGEVKNSVIFLRKLAQDEEHPDG